MRVKFAYVVLWLFSFSAHADSPELDRDSVIVTGTRTSESISESPASVTVLARDDIDRLQAADVRDVLLGLPGVQLTNTGGRGKATTLLLRGTNSDHVLVLIDGIKIGSATSGTVAFEQLPLDEIERIEIVRGPRSSLYGSEALGGVIQLFTRRAHGATPLELSSLKGTTGSLST